MIKRLCKCGCGGVTNYGNRYIHGHNKSFQRKYHSEKTKSKISLANKGQTAWGKGKKISEETKRKISLANTGKTRSKEAKLKMSLAKFKIHPNDNYCEAWRDTEYKKDLKKDHCENADCKGIYKRLNNHHINLNKKDCRPFNVMTLCACCHSNLHWKLIHIEKDRISNHKNFLIIIRKDHITYIHKGTKKYIKLWIMKQL